MILLAHWASAQKDLPLYFKHLTPHEGLSQTIVNNIMQDQFGFMWFTTYDGVSRFDGVACKSNVEIAPGAEGLTRAKGIVEDQNGNIWIGQVDCIFRFNYVQNQFVKLVPKGETNSGWKKHMEMFEPVYATESHLLVKTQINTFIIIDLQSHEVVHFFQLNLGLPDSLQWPVEYNDLAKRVYAIAHIYEKDYLFIPEHGAEVRVPWQMFELTPTKSIAAIDAIFVSADTAVYFVDLSNEIWSYNVQKHKLRAVHKPILTWINHLQIDSQGVLWVSASSGLLKLDAKTGALLSHYTQEPQNPESLPGQNCLHSFVSKEGIIWTSVWGRGVSYASLEDDGFNHYLTDNESLKFGIDNFVRGIVQWPDGRFYCNTNAGGILELDESLGFAKQVFDTKSTFIFADSEAKHIYFGDSILYRYNPSTHAIQSITQTPENIAKYPHSKHFRHMASKKNGEALIGSIMGVWKVDKNFREIRDIPGLNESTLYETLFTYEDKHENIYKYSYHGGLEYFSKKTDAYEITYKFPERFVTYQIYEEHDTLVWIGTSVGLIRFNPVKKRITAQFTSKDGLPNNTIYAMAPDSMGRLWLSTNRGIASINKKDGFIRQYHDNRGAGSIEYNARVVITARDGRIIFGGTRGLTAIEPGRIAPQTILPELHFSSIQTDQLINPYPFNLNQSNLLEIPSGINTIEIGIAAMDLMNPRAHQIKYRLLGVDEEWVIRSNPAQARYTKLPPGTYTFAAIAINGDRFQSEQPKLLNIEIAAFWWQEWWFKVLVITVAISLIIALVSYYTTYKLREKQWSMEKEKSIINERERITADLHDDMGASLSSMHIFSELATQSWESQPTMSREMIHKIKQQSSELMSRMNDIVWSLKTPNGQSHSFVDRLKNCSADLLSAKEIQIDFKHDEDIEGSLNNPILRKNMLLIAKEAFNNIAKHSGASAAEVEIREDASRIVLRISDNGSGLPETDTSQGNGLDNMALRCQQMGGKFEIYNTPGSGLTIICIVPMAKISYLASGK